MKSVVALLALAGAAAWAAPSDPPQAATAFVDFSAATGPSAASLRSTGPYSYGINMYSAFATKSSGDPAYQSCVQDTTGVDGVGLLRYHREQQMEDSATESVGWVQDASDPDKCGWNETRIASVLGSVPWLDNSTSSRRVMMGITGWPDCMADKNNSGALLPGSYGAFASLCADLVTLVNGKLRLGVRVFEVTNELDSKSEYSGGNMSKVGTIVAQAAAAMRKAQEALRRSGAAVDGGSDLLIGGPAFARPDLTDAVRAFVSTAGASTDFLTYHSYSTGDGTKANSSIWDSAQTAGSFTDGVRNAAVQACQAAGATTGLCSTASKRGEGMVLLHDEINISWNPPDVRMTNGVGAVYDALALRSIQQHGAAAARWNEADGWYGACDGGPAYERRPPSFAHAIQARFARGRIVPAASFPDDGRVVAVTGTAAGGGWSPGEGVASPSDFAVVLINRSGGPATATVLATFAPGTAPPAGRAVGVHTVDGTGIAERDTTWGAIATGPGGSPVVSLPQDSVTVIEWNATSA